MRTLTAGLLAGLVINLFDVPNSIFLGAPLLNADLARWGVNSMVWMPAYMVSLHFVLGIALVWLYRQLRAAGRTGFAAWGWSTLILIGLNRLFSFGSVAIGTLSPQAFVVFSWAFVVGTSVGGGAGALMVERRATDRGASQAA